MSSETPPIQVLLGVLVLIAFLAIGFALFVAMRSDPRLFGATIDLEVRMPERTSLKIGDPVEIDGIQVGSVRSIRRAVRGEQTSFLVFAEVQAEAEPLGWLGAASRARARTVNVLGDTVLSIRGDPRGTGLAPGQVIPGDRTPGFDDLLADMRTTMASAQRIVGGIEGALTAPGEQGQPRVETVAAAIAELSQSLAQISTTVNRRMPPLLENLEHAAAELRVLIATLAGPAGKEGEERPALGTILANLVAATDHASAVTASLRKLFAGGLDADLVSRMIGDLQSAAQNLNTITGDIRAITARVRTFFGR